MKTPLMIAGMMLAAALASVWAAEDVPTVYLRSPITMESTFADGTIARVWPDKIELHIPEREVPEPLRPVINTNTVITIDGKPARPADLRVGMAAHVVFDGAQEDTAKEIKAQTAPGTAQFDPERAKQAAVVLRVKLVAKSGADKYAWYEVEILKVFKNESGETFGQTLKIAAYSWKTGVPAGESTVYLERYNQTDKGLWKLVGGEAATGVSHVQKPAQAGTNPPAAIAWQDLFAGEDWYKSQPGKETFFTGQLEAMPQAGGASTLMRNSYYKLGDRTIYTGARKVETLDRLVGQAVEIRGKAVEMELEGQRLKEIWPAAIRPAK